MNATTSAYEQQAQDFLTKTGATITAIYDRTAKYFPDDESERDIYKVTMKRGNRKYTFNFGQSINDSGKYKLSNYVVYEMDKRGEKTYFGDAKTGYFSHKKPTAIHGATQKDIAINKDFSAPTAYDILAAVTKSDPGTFENFCSEYGYDTDSKKAEKIYHAVVNEYQNLAMLFSDSELEEMQEIQ